MKPTSFQLKKLNIKRVFAYLHCENLLKVKMDSTNTAIISMGVLMLFAGIYLKRKNARRTARRYWVNPYLRERANKGRYHNDVCIV